MIDSSEYKSKNIAINERNFKIQSVYFCNGYFISVSEGDEDRLGSLTLSMKIQNRVEHTNIIPDSRAGPLSSILSDMISNVSQGITILSLYVLQQLDTESASKLIREIKSYLDEL
jgi:hypothetical protein